jgi:hypothetical protein
MGLFAKLTSAMQGRLWRISMFSIEKILLKETSNTVKLGNFISISVMLIIPLP